MKAEARVGHVGHVSNPPMSGIAVRVKARGGRGAEERAAHLDSGHTNLDLEGNLLVRLHPRQLALDLVEPVGVHPRKSLVCPCVGERVHSQPEEVECSRRAIHRLSHEIVHHILGETGVGKAHEAHVLQLLVLDFSKEPTRLALILLYGSILGAVARKKVKRRPDSPALRKLLTGDVDVLARHGAHALHGRSGREGQRSARLTKEVGTNVVLFGDIDVLRRLGDRQGLVVGKLRAPRGEYVA